MSRNQARFSQMPRAAVIDTRLSSTDFKVLAIIGLYLNHDFDAWPSQETIAEVGGMSRRTVIRAIQNLEEFGYIESRKKFPNRPGTHKCYRVVMDGTPESAISDTSDKHRGTKPESDKSGTSGSVTRVTYGSDIAVSHPIGTNPVELTEAKASVEAHASVLPLTLIPEQPNSQKGKGKVRGTARGSRISENWSPTVKDFAFAAKHNLTREEINREADRFRNYWLAAAGSKGVKLDWEATWRNWLTGEYGIVTKRAAALDASRNGVSADPFERLATKLQDGPSGPDAWQHDDPGTADGYVIDAGPARLAG